MYNYPPYGLLVLSHGHVRSIRRESDTVSSPQRTEHKIIQVVYKTVTRGPNVHPLINALQRKAPLPEMGDSGRTHSTKMDIALPISVPSTQKENDNKWMQFLNRQACSSTWRNTCGRNHSSRTLRHILRTKYLRRIAYLFVASLRTTP